MDKTTSAAVFNRLREEFHDVIWAGGGTNNNEVFTYIVKLLLCKIYDEKETGPGCEYQFQRRGDETSPESPASLVDRLNEMYRRSEEDDSDKAHAALQSWVAQDITRIATHLMPFEVANALHRRVLRGELNVGDSIRMMARLLASRLELHQPPDLHVRALQLASLLKQNAAYDAHYLALAESFVCELWTADERFYRSASPSIDNVRWLGEFVAPE